MLRQFTAIIIICFLSFYSCKKEESIPKPVIGKTYSKEKIDKNGKLRLYASTGEITDAAILSRYETYSSSYLSNYIDYYVQGPQLDSLIFLNEVSARLVDDYASRTFEYTHDKTNIILVQRDTVSLSVYGNLYSNSLVYLVGKYKTPIYSEQLVSSVGGEYLFTARGKIQNVFNIAQNIISAPLIAAVRYTPRSTGVNLVNNEFSPEFYQKLDLTDTVVIQLYSVTYQ
jgi:hypothetical protein